MKTPKQRYLARSRRTSPDGRGVHAFRRPKAARRKAVRASRMSASRIRRRAETEARWQRAEAEAERLRSAREAMGP